MSIHGCLKFLLSAVASMLVAGPVHAQEPHEEAETGFAERCKTSLATLCLSLNSAQEIARYRESPRHLVAENQIRWDPERKAARFTIPPLSPADSSGQLHIPFPSVLGELYFSIDVRYPADFLRYRFRGSAGWKLFILGQGRQGCAPYEIVGINQYYRGHPGFYYMCGAFHSVDMQNPLGDNLSQFDYQPGGDTACPRQPDPRSKPCAWFEPDEWVTYQVHISTLAATLEVWQTVRGKTLKIIEHQLRQFPHSVPGYEWLKLTPYNTGKDATEIHPPFAVWYRRLIVSTGKIPFPVARP